MFKLHRKRPKFDAQQYDDRLNQAIEHTKYNYEKARLSEEAMFDSDIAPQMIKAETALAKQKYFFVLRAARQRGMKGHWSTAFVHPEK